MDDEHYFINVHLKGPYADIKKMLADYEFRQEFIEKANTRPLNDLEAFALNMLYLIKDDHEANRD